MIGFNRVREKDKGRTVTLERNYDQLSGARVCSEKFWPDGLIKKPVVNIQRICDQIPQEAYTPGKLKLTNVMLDRIIDEPCEADYFVPSAKRDCPALWYYGTVAPAMTPIVRANAFLSASPVDPLRVRRLRMQAYSKLNSSKTGLGESLAEASQVLRMLRHPLEGLSNLFKDFVYSRRLRRFRTLKELSGIWLEIRYGIVPLYSTISKLTKPLKVSGLLDEQASEVISDVKYPNVWAWQTAVDPGRTTFYSTSISEVKEVHRYRLYYSVVDVPLYRAFAFGSSVFQTPQLAWELTHLSFVLDWWFNIGDAIGAATMNPSVFIQGETFSIRKYIKRTWHASVVNQCASGSLPRPYYSLPCGLTVSNTVDHYYREVQEYEPLKVYPEFNGAYKSFKHALDAIGLIIQRVPRRYPKPF